MTTVWNPTQYAKFADERSRPFFELLARVGAPEPKLVADLGCGNGPLTLSLAQRWPQARIVGVDSSTQMLDAARDLDAQGRVEWRRADLAIWDLHDLGAIPDVIVTNATLQWIPRHLELIDAWARALPPGGWFAMQVPGNYGAPSHRLMREVAVTQPRGGELEAALKRGGSAEPATYLQVLHRAGLRVEAWETTYLHVLDPQHELTDPVLEWVKGTGLRPVLDLLTQEHERAAFEQEYAARLREAYPRTSAGVILPFRRVFAVGHRP